MKKITYLMAVVSLMSGFSMMGLAGTTVTFHTESKKGADGKATTYWVATPDTIPAGEQVTILAKHELEGGFDYHGLFIPELKVNMTVNRSKPGAPVSKTGPIEQTVTVPANLAPKDPSKPTVISAKCHFHATHIPAELKIGAPSQVASKK